MSKLIPLVIVCLLPSLLACGQDASAPAKPAASAAAVAGAAVLNANCPIMGEPVEAKGGTSAFRGHTIGFCCRDCVKEFDALDDAGKVAALAKHGTKLPG